MGVVGIDHTLNFGGFHDRIKRGDLVDYLYHFGGNRRADRGSVEIVQVVSEGLSAALMLVACPSNM